MIQKILITQGVKVIKKKFNENGIANEDIVPVIFNTVKNVAKGMVLLEIKTPSEPLSKKCCKCGAELDGSSNYCSDCGTKLE